MGRHTDYITGYGKNRDEAYSWACRDFRDEYGYSQTIEKMLDARLIERTPPNKLVNKLVPQMVQEYSGWYGHPRWVQSGKMVEVPEPVPDPAAPADQWTEEWQFEVLVHM